MRWNTSFVEYIVPYVDRQHALTCWVLWAEVDWGIHESRNLAVRLNELDLRYITGIIIAASLRVPTSNNMFGVTHHKPLYR